MRGHETVLGPKVLAGREPDGAAAPPFLRARAITKSFGGVRALRGVDFDIRGGQVHAIAGENGAGKSTLIRVIMGVVAPDSGELAVNGEVVRVTSPKVARELGFAAVHQEALIYPHLSALENLFMASPVRSRYGGLDWGKMRRLATPVLESIGGDPRILRLPMSELRLGHQQLVLISQALLQDARLIIFDEPTAILSAAETDRLVSIIGSLRNEGRAVIYISHRVEELGRIADEVSVMTDGLVVGRLSKDEIDVAQVVRMMARGEERIYEVPARARVVRTREGPARLSVERLTKVGMYEDVSFELSQGEVLGLYGQVGSGRSEMALGILGAMRPDSGIVRLDGREVRFRSPGQAVKHGLGFVPEDRKSQGIFASLPITWNMASAVLPKLEGRLYNVPRPKLLEVATRYRERLHIRLAALSDAIGSLSGGGQQKVVLGRWLAARLKVLVLDEPTRGIDVATKSEFHHLIRQLAEEGLAVLVISSDLPEVLAVADRVIVMQAGRVAKRFDDLDGVSPEDLVRAAVASATVSANTTVPGPVAARGSQ
jgi:ribose transport system ATP-binding protein